MAIARRRAMLLRWKARREKGAKHCFLSGAISCIVGAVLAAYLFLWVEGWAGLTIVAVLLGGGFYLIWLGKRVLAGTRADLDPLIEELDV